MLLICSCGQKLNTPGATPGRVGRCPRCGSFLEVDAASSSVERPVAPAGPEREDSATAYRPFRTDRRLPESKLLRADGVVAFPRLAERSILASLLYPFRGGSGIDLMASLPPLLWLGSAPLFVLIPLAGAGSPRTGLASLMFLPLIALFGLALGHLAAFLGEVVVSSCLGEVALPAGAGWNPVHLGRAGVLWIWALLVGGFAGGWPALAYWLRCGAVDWLDQIILIDLILPGMAYAQMALVLALTENSPWSAANPARVVGSIMRGGWGYIWPCLITGGLVAAAVTLLKGCLELSNPFAVAVGFWGWWVITLYLAMVALRRLGLHCYRSKAVAVAPGRRRRRG